jgi:hypothetical protein
MELTAEQIAHRKLMDEVNAAFKENPIEPTNKNLKQLADKLKERGLMFDPRELCKCIDVEAKRQYQELFDASFRGQHISSLTNAKDEVIKWFNDEEDRFSKFKDGYIMNKFAPEEVLNIPIVDDEATGELTAKLLTLKKKGKK